MPDDTVPPAPDMPPADAMTAFCMLILGDAGLQARLGAIDAPAAFVADVLALAAAHDIALDAERIGAMIAPDPLGIGRWMPSPVNLSRWPLSGWLPARTVPAPGAPAFDWAWFGTNPLDAPFFEDSVRHFATRPLSLMFRTRTSMQALVDGAGEDPAAHPDPSGFIFHMSRCGSTLVAQMLAADPSHVVLSEPEPLDGVLRWAISCDVPSEAQIAAVRAVVAALGRNRTGPESRLFVKLDSAHTAALPLLRAAFPRTPWTYLYRNPVEVLVSQLRHRGMHTIPGMLPVEFFAVADGETLDPEHYVALVLARCGAEVLDHWDLGGGLLVEYDELPGAAIDRIAPHFGLMLDRRARDAMVAATAYDAKARDQRFSPDAAQKRGSATPAIRSAAQAFVVPVYDRLRTLRDAAVG